MPKRNAGYAWPEDKEHCEEPLPKSGRIQGRLLPLGAPNPSCVRYGRMLNADPGKVSSRAKKPVAEQRSFHWLLSRRSCFDNSLRGVGCLS